MRILVACDGSEIGESAVAAIIPFVTAIDCQIHLIHVLDPSDIHGVTREPLSGTLFPGPSDREGTAIRSPARGASVSLSGSDIEPEQDPGILPETPVQAENRGQQLDRARSETFDYLRRLADRYFPSKAVEVHPEFGEHPAEVIASQASEIGASLIVMGTHGRSGISRAIMGSVAGDVVRTAGVPVMLVGPGVRKE